MSVDNSPALRMATPLSVLAKETPTKQGGTKPKKAKSRAEIEEENLTALLRENMVETEYDCLTLESPVDEKRQKPVCVL